MASVCDKRSAGVLLPVSSLPSPYGIGSFGQSARQWIDFLCEAGQSYWQILPLGPTGFGDSPYQCFSAFAGNPFYVDLALLREEGLLEKADFGQVSWGACEERVDYPLLYQQREPVLRKAFSRFRDEAALDAFIAANPWFSEYGLFMAIKATQEQRSWIKWSEALRLRKPKALARMQEQLAWDIRYHAFVQYQFHRQWHALHAYAQTKGLRIIGDIPIYVSMDSADAWAERDLFQLDAQARPIEVAGCPPDYFSPEGQFWGNPLYNWEAMENAGFPWWIRRLQSNFALYDVLRIDHFRGLESYYAIPYGAKSAKYGEWKPGPGNGFIETIRKAFPEALIIAEDLGFLTDEVRKLLSDSGYPGMKLLQFAFDSREPGDYSPYYYSANTVVYPGTHDNETVKGWCKTAPRAAVRRAMAYINIRRRSHLPRGMIRLAMQSNAGLVIIPMQDWLELDSGARINIPSTVGGNNWRWRMRQDAADSRLAEEMARMTQLYGRRPAKPTTVMRIAHHN